jgi:hypothetical protein
MFNLNKKIESPRPEKDSQKSYEEYASKEAREYNSFIENLLGKGVINKEDIMRVDAELESSLMDEIKEQKENQYKNPERLALLEKELEFLKSAEKISTSMSKEEVNILGNNVNVPVAKAKTIKGEHIKALSYYDHDTYEALDRIQTYRKIAIENLVKERKEQK